jgi:hypothetical protein
VRLLDRPSRSAGEREVHGPGSSDGVPEKTVVEDFLLSDEYPAASQ